VFFFDHVPYENGGEFYLILLLYDENCQVALYAKHTGHSKEKIEEDIKRPKYFSPEEAMEYGIIDKVNLEDQFSLPFLSLELSLIDTSLPLSICITSLELCSYKL
jgi:hypothetical protein